MRIGQSGLTVPWTSRHYGVLGGVGPASEAQRRAGRCVWLVAAAVTLYEGPGAPAGALTSWRGATVLAPDS